MKPYLWLLPFMRDNVASSASDFAPITTATETTNILVVQGYRGRRYTRRVELYEDGNADLKMKRPDDPSPQADVGRRCRMRETAGATRRPRLQA